MYQGTEHIIGDILIGEKATIVLKKPKFIRLGESWFKGDFQLFKWFSPIIDSGATHCRAMCYALGDELLGKIKFRVRAQPQQHILRKKRVAQALKDAYLLSIGQPCFICFFMKCQVFPLLFEIKRKLNFFTLCFLIKVRSCFLF